MTEKRDFAKERRDIVFEKIRKDLDEKKQIEESLRGFVGLSILCCFGVLVGIGIWGFIRLILYWTGG